MNTFEITKENTAATLRNRKVVTVGPVFTGIKVTSVKEGMFDKNGREYAIINLGACTKRQAAHAVKAYNEGNYESALNGEEGFGRTSLSTNVYPDAQQLPVKGEVVNIRLEERWSENLGMNIEVVAQLTIPTPVVAKGISLTEVAVEEDADNS